MLVSQGVTNLDEAAWDVTGISHMRLQDCFLDVDQVVTHPLKRTSPEEDWVSARDSGAIPRSLFGLYEAADYLSFGVASGFLTDPERVLFGYFGMLLRGLKDALLEGADLAKEFEQAQRNIYDPVKRLRGEQWDPQAPLRARRTFGYLTITLSSCLDPEKHANRLGVRSSRDTSLDGEQV